MAWLRTCDKDDKQEAAGSGLLEPSSAASWFCRRQPERLKPRHLPHTLDYLAQGLNDRIIITLVPGPQLNI